MAEDKKKLAKNNSGFSLVELIIVIAIIAALIGTVVLSVSMVFSECQGMLQRSAACDCGLQGDNNGEGTGMADRLPGGEWPYLQSASYYGAEGRRDGR